MRPASSLRICLTEPLSSPTSFCGGRRVGLQARATLVDLPQQIVELRHGARVLQAHTLHDIEPAEKVGEAPRGEDEVEDIDVLLLVGRDRPLDEGSTRDLDVELGEAELTLVGRDLGADRVGASRWRGRSRRR